MDELLRADPPPTPATDNLSAPPRTSTGLLPTPVGALATSTVSVAPKSDVQGDGPLLSAGDVIPDASHSSTNVRHSGSGQATSSCHPLFPVDCGFEYNQEAAVHGHTGSWLDACPQGCHSAEIGCQGSGFTPRLQPQWQTERKGNDYACSPRAPQTYFGARNSRNAVACPDHRRYDADVDAEYSQDDEASLTQGGEINSL